MSSQFENIHFCYHEAGHAVCCLLMFMRVSSLSLAKTGTISGEVLYNHISEAHNPDQEIVDFINKSNIYVSYAGLAAEQILYKNVTGSSTFPRVLREGTEQDIENAAKIIKTANLAAPGRKRYLLKKKMMRNVSYLLSQYWDIVQIVAHELFDKKSLNHDDLKKIICKKAKNKKFWIKRFEYINEYINKEKILDLKDIKIITSALDI